MPAGADPGVVRGANKEVQEDNGLNQLGLELGALALVLSAGGIVACELWGRAVLGAASVFRNISMAIWLVYGGHLLSSKVPKLASTPANVVS